MDKAAFTGTIEVAGKRYSLFDITALEKQGLASIGRLPFCIRVLVENLLRKLDGEIVKEEDLLSIARWQKKYETPVEIPFHPTRVLMQDFTGVPAVVDLAAMRDVMLRMDGDPGRINPLVPVDLVIDHSVQVDFYGTSECRKLNVSIEYRENSERYACLKWAQKSFDNFRIIPPGSGICHQVNLEYLSGVIASAEVDGRTFVCPETLVGTDSHTTMINGIGVLGWGVGGIEAEAVMLGQPYYMAIPEVIGVRFVGRFGPGVTAMDLTLHMTQVLRKYGVVEKFVEYFGPGLKNLPVENRATLANMSPEYGATMGFFPIDEKTLEYLARTNRGDRVELVRDCARKTGLFYAGDGGPEYTDVIEIDLSTIEPAVAGPSRPFDRIPLRDLGKSAPPPVMASEPPAGAVDPLSADKRLYPVIINGKIEHIGDGSVVMASITSCTNTSNPHALLGAGLLARNAVKKGLRVPAYVKTVLAPGSRVVPRYLERACLLPYLEALGFHVAGFGCMTCIGNSGPLDLQIDQVIREKNLNVAVVLSGNRNFEARIHPRIRSNYLASPALVVAFALAGHIAIDFATEPVGLDPNSHPVYLADIWPENAEIEELLGQYLLPDAFASEYESIFEGDDLWRRLRGDGALTFSWDTSSLYVKAPPYFEFFNPVSEPPRDISGARALLLLGDSVTTDHISPSGSIPRDYPAGKYLTGAGIKPAEFNSYGSRRGNHEVMMRATFANIRIKNGLVAPREGGFTRKFPENSEMFVYDAAMAYTSEGVDLIVLAGREYGTGSSRDWAAKGTRLLGVKAVVAQSFERIHRSNLVGMGVLPLTFRDGESCEALGLDGSELFSLSGIAAVEPRGLVKILAVKPDGTRIEFEAEARLYSALEADYFKNGGILPYVLRKILSGR
ncbi:MAG: aconitate hydratase AcnA [Desulfobacteraceae bacterium]|nr:aconitate hydratase AcnA [Desulfobacteraceae bacterium]